MTSGIVDLSGKPVPPADLGAFRSSLSHLLSGGAPRSPREAAMGGPIQAANQLLQSVQTPVEALILAWTLLQRAGLWLPLTPEGKQQIRRATVDAATLATEILYTAWKAMEEAEQKSLNGETKAPQDVE